MPTRKHSSSTRTYRDITIMTSDRDAKRPIVDRQTPVKTLPSLTVGKNVDAVAVVQVLWKRKLYELQIALQNIARVNRP